MAWFASLLALALWLLVDARPDGSPICTDQPGHGSLSRRKTGRDAQIEFQFVSSSGEECYRLRENLTVRLVSTGLGFNGFVIQSIQQSTRLEEGRFFDIGAKFRRVEKESCITHTDPWNKNSVDATWQAPNYPAGTIEFKATIFRADSQANPTHSGDYWPLAAVKSLNPCGTGGSRNPSSTRQCGIDGHVSCPKWVAEDPSVCTRETYEKQKCKLSCCEESQNELTNNPVEDPEVWYPLLTPPRPEDCLSWVDKSEKCPSWVQERPYNCRSPTVICKKSCCEILVSSVPTPGPPWAAPSRITFDNRVTPPRARATQPPVWTTRAPLVIFYSTIPPRRTPAPQTTQSFSNQCHAGIRDFYLSCPRWVKFDGRTCTKPDSWESKNCKKSCCPLTGAVGQKLANFATPRPRPRNTGPGNCRLLRDQDPGCPEWVRSDPYRCQRETYERHYCFRSCCSFVFA